MLLNLLKAKPVNKSSNFKMNKYDEALKYIRESLSIDSSNSTIQGHLDTIIKSKTKFNTQKMQQAEN